MTRLPASVDELRGLRAARWIRESSDPQADANGPEMQRIRQDHAIAKTGLVDTGLAWTATSSGWKRVWETGEWSAMLAGAGRDYDVLVVAYFSRFLRNLEQAMRFRTEFHARGAAIWIADERILSSNDDDWDQWVREAHEAESYSRRLARRTREAYEAKFLRFADPGGPTPAGFRRGTERPHLLELDPLAIARVVELFRRYAAGDIALAALATEHGLPTQTLRKLLGNPVYNGWVRRGVERAPARWRADPPVDDELWARVQEVRDRRSRGVHPSPRYVHLLGGRLWCSCGARFRSSAKPTRPTARYVHRCERSSMSSVASPILDEAIAAQIGGIRIDAAWLASLRRLAELPVPDGSALRRRQIERELAAAATSHGRRRTSTELYLAEHRRLAAELDVLDAAPPVPRGTDPDAAVAFARDLTGAWPETTAAERAAIIGAIYDRIEVEDGRFVSVRLTPEAAGHGLALAMPEAVRTPRGSRRHFQGWRGVRRIPIEGRAELLELLRRVG